MFAGRLIGIVERTRADALLGIQVTSPPARVRPEGTWAGLRSFLTDPVGWKGLGYGMLMLPIGITNFTIVVTMWAVTLAGTTYPVVGVGGAGAVRRQLRDPRLAESSATSPALRRWSALLIATPHVIRGLAAMDGGLIKGILGGRRQPNSASASRPSPSAVMPRSTSPRPNGGASNVTCTTVCRPSSSRWRWTSAWPDRSWRAATTPTQQFWRWSSAPTTTRSGPSRPAQPGTRHPSRGADRPRARRSGVGVRGAQPDPGRGQHRRCPTRPPATVESAAYFVIAEALTNAAKHSGASLINVDARVVGGVLRVEVRDDGVGGADVEHGGGLAGLASRVAAIEGRLRVASPVGGPTTVLAELPLPVGSSATAGRRRHRDKISPMRIVIVEDSVLLREGIVRLLSESGHDVVAQLVDADALLATVEELHPDLVVLDVRLPPTFTDEGIRAAVARPRRAPVAADPGALAVRRGALCDRLLASDSEGIGYLLKERVADVGDFVDACQRVAAGGTVLDPEVVAQLLARRRRGPFDGLTPRDVRCSD